MGEKTHQLSNDIIMTSVGEPGDAKEFADFIAKNCRLYKMQNGYDLSTHAAASFVRRNLADYLRSRTPFNVNLMITGKGDESFELYTLDYLASMVKVPFAVHGYGGFFAKALQDCVKEIQKRLVINMPSFDVTFIDESGTKKMD